MAEPNPNAESNDGMGRVWAARCWTSRSGKYAFEIDATVKKAAIGVLDRGEHAMSFVRK
jgi:hypothetical protein